MYSPELNARMIALRAKMAEGTLEEGEMQEVVRALRGERLSAVQSAARKRNAASGKTVKSADDLLDELVKS